MDESDERSGALPYVVVLEALESNSPWLLSAAPANVDFSVGGVGSGFDVGVGVGVLVSEEVRMS